MTVGMLFVRYDLLQKLQNDLLVELDPSCALLNSECSSFPATFPLGIKPISFSLSIISATRDQWYPGYDNSI